jgi:hypothetical protein
VELFENKARQSKIAHIVSPLKITDQHDMMRFLIAVADSYNKRFWQVWVCQLLTLPRC